MKLRARIFSSRAWPANDGDPSRPQAVLGVPVAEQLGTRRDAPGALVRLADQRYALTGAVLAVGSRRQLDRYIRRRAQKAGSAEWYAEARRLLDAEARDATAEDGV